MAARFRRPYVIYLIIVVDANCHRALSDRDDIVGVVPAAGWAHRLGAIPCSKEVYPLGFAENGKSPEGPRPPKVAGQYLLERMRQASADRIFVVIRESKWDIPAYFGDGSDLGVPMGYLMMDHPYGVSFTINQAFPFVQGARVITGFPHILFRPLDAYEQLLGKQQRTGADVVLGLFPARKPSKMDMVAHQTDGRVDEILIKPEETSLTYTWIIATWTPSFTHYLNEYINGLLDAKLGPDGWNGGEVHLGHALQAALEDGLRVTSVRFRDGRYIDIGTPTDLEKAVHTMNIDTLTSYDTHQ